MAFGTGLSLPSAQGLPTPEDIRCAYEQWQPNPSEFVFRDLLPDSNFDTPFIGYDVEGSPEGLLAASDGDSAPTPTATRELETVALQAVFKQKSIVTRPSDATNQRAAGSLNRIDPWARIIKGLEDVAIAIEATKEVDRIAALTGTMQPVIHGANGATYTYPVQTATAGTLWSNVAADIIGNIGAMADSLAGWGGQPTLYIPRAVALAAAKNTALVGILSGSTYATLLSSGPGGGVTIQDQAICEVLRIFTGVGKVVMYDGGYRTLDRSTGNYTFNRFMPQNKVLMVAQPPKGQPLGFYGMVPTVNKGGFENPQPGVFMNSFDHSKIRPNGGYEIHGGFSGVPGIIFPKAVVCWTVL